MASAQMDSNSAISIRLSFSNATSAGLVCMAGILTLHIRNHRQGEWRMKKILLTGLAVMATSAAMAAPAWAGEVALCYQAGGMAPPPPPINGVFDDSARVTPPPPPAPAQGFGKLTPTDRMECFLHEDTQ